MAVPKRPTIITSPLVANGEKNVIPQDTPLGSNAFSVNAGFPPITATPIQAGGIPPDRLDFNGVFNLLSQHTFFLESGNKYEWNNKLDYMFGATVLGSDSALYFCIQANGASEPNTIQDPVSSSGYWVKLVNSDGKINADNLSVVLGSFALLNSLALNDGKLTGILPIDKGGTNANSAQNAANNILASIATSTTLGSSDYIYVYSASGVKRITLANFNNVITTALPIGFIYFQLKGQQTPDQVFKTSGKWQDISASYAGEFFRAAGGAAAAYGQSQGQGLPNITGEFTVRGNSDLSWYIPFGDVKGAFSTRTTSRSMGATASGNAGTQNAVLLFSAQRSSSIYGASANVTPINSTIRVWKKIS